MTNRVLHLDFEAFSTLDLRKVGVENFIRCPDFAVTALAWAFDDEPVHSYQWPHTQLPLNVRRHIVEEGGTIKAWNASFERAILRYSYSLYVEPGQMDCVMQRSLAFGLPAALQDAGDALGLGTVKDAAARRLMLQMSKPKPDGTCWHSRSDPEALAKLIQLAGYCRQDVEAERALDRVIPPLHPFEREVSGADALINDAGVLIDIGAVDALQDAVAYEMTLLNQECDRLTAGAVTSPGTQTSRLLAWVAIATHNAVLPDATKASVEHALTGYLPNNVRRVLEIRQLSAKSSTSKLERMAAWSSSHDQRARGLLQFYGAGRTGRWAGRGIQVQNLPRPAKGLDADTVIRAAQASPDAIGMLWPAPLTAISGSLRGCLVARPGHRLVSIDLSQIEARVLAWLAGQQSVLDTFAKGEDIYSYAAALQGSSNRQFGKVLVLACGFGMGPAKFQETAASYGVTLTLAEADTAVTRWRADNPKIQRLWWAVGNAATQVLGGWVMEERKVALDHEGVAPLGRVKLALRGGCLAIKKPTGVKLWYQNARVERNVGLIGGGGIVFDGMDQVTNQWVTQRTYGGKLVENITQSIARDIMAEALVAAMKAGLRPIMTVHDEIVWEVPVGIASATADTLKAIVETPPAWAAGLPLASEIKISQRYGK